MPKLTLTRENFVGPWAGLPVAWTGDNRFDEDTYRQDVAKCCRAGVPGVYTGGTTGEFYAQEFDEFKAVTRAAVETCRPLGTPVMIGCTSTYTLGAARRAAYAAETGANAIQVAMPFWMPIPCDQIVPFYKEVAAAAPGLALSVYETQRAKVALTLDQHRAIQEAVPDYLMVKSNEGTVGVEEDGCRALSQRVNVFVGENLFGKLGRCGMRGCCSSLIYWAPKFMLGLWRQTQAGAPKRDTGVPKAGVSALGAPRLGTPANWAAVDAGCAKIERLFGFLFETWGPRHFTDSAYDRLGGIGGGFLRSSLRCRGPYPGPTPKDVETYRNWCREHFPEMLEG